MFSTIQLRKWFLILALPMLAMTATTRADDDAERQSILAAIDAINGKIDAAYQAIDTINGELPKIRAEFERFKSLYEKEKKDTYLKGMQDARAKYHAKEAQRDQLEIQIQEYFEVLAELDARLSQLGG